MECLSNGMVVKFWIPVEEHPDIDRFVDEQIMIDMDHFMLVGNLVKVGTCKKKNEEKEYEYFKQLTISVMNICSAENNNINIAIPTGKEEFLYEVKFRYAPEPEQLEEDMDMEEADTEFSDGMAKKEETLNGSDEKGQDEPDNEAMLADDQNAEPEPDNNYQWIEDDEFDDHNAEPEPDNEAMLADDHNAEPEPDNEDDFDAMFADDQDDMQISGHDPENPEPEKKEKAALVEDLDEDGINWGD